MMPERRTPASGAPRLEEKPVSTAMVPKKESSLPETDRLVVNHCVCSVIESLDRLDSHKHLAGVRQRVSEFNLERHQLPIY